MKKILLLLILNSSLNAEDKVNKDQNITKSQQENSSKKEQKIETNSNVKKEKDLKEKPKKPEYLEINSIALEIARKKFEKESQFLNSCDSLTEESKKQNLIIENGKKIYSYSAEEIEKVLNIIKIRKKEVRNIQSTVMQILGQESKVEDSYLDDKEELPKNEQKNDINKDSSKDSLENFSEYFKEYENKDEKEKVRNKIKSAQKVKIAFKDFEKSSQDAIKRLSGSYYKIIDIIFLKLILDSVDGKTWEEKKVNFKKELPEIQKTEAKMNEKMAQSFKKKNENKKDEKDQAKEKAETKGKEKEKEEKNEELKDKINPMHKKIIDTNFTYILFPLYSYSSFNPYSVALDIENTWKKKGLMD